jgi:uncharacterized membrane protein
MRTLLRDFQQDARLNQVFVVHTLGSTLIATLGLLANSAAVVIGAMIIAPWITPLRATAFGILRGRLSQVLEGLVTLAAGAGITVSLSFLLGKVSGLPDFGNEVLSRTHRICWIWASPWWPVASPPTPKCAARRCRRWRARPSPWPWCHRCA